MPRAYKSTPGEDARRDALRNSVDEADRIVGDALDLAWKRVRWVIQDAAKADDFSLKRAAQTIYLLGVWDGATVETDRLKNAIIKEL